MDCSKRRVAAVGDLPVDPLVEILSRVPVKSVCRFKCVSKAWCDLIADPHHRKKLPQTMQGFFYDRHDNSSRAYSFSFIDVTARSVPLDIDLSFSFLTELPGIQVLVLLGSCNGLILFGHKRDSSLTFPVLGYIVCNPATKEWEAVPPCGAPSLTRITHAYLAFDPALSSHFNLVQFQVNLNDDFLSVHAYSSETGTWSANQIDERGEEGQLNGWCHVRFYHAKPRPHSFFKGFLHLLVWDPDLVVWVQDQMKIVAVDVVQGKMRKMIPVPHGANNMIWRLSYFGESQGHLHYMSQEIVDVGEGMFKLSVWVLQDYDTEEWVFKHTVDTNEVFGKYNCTVNSWSEFVVVDIHQDCDVVFFTQFWTNKLVAYDMSHKEVAVITTVDDQNTLLHTFRYVPFFRKSPVLTNKH